MHPRGAKLFPITVCDLKVHKNLSTLEPDWKKCSKWLSMIEGPLSCMLPSVVNKIAPLSILFMCLKRINKRGRTHHIYFGT